jgi:HlyD family secretion protein
MAVANTAVVQRDGVSYVYRITAQEKNSATVEEVAIKPGRKLGDLLEFTGNIKSGDKLVATPPATIKNGGRVNLGAS